MKVHKIDLTNFRWTVEITARYGDILNFLNSETNFHENWFQTNFHIINNDELQIQTGDKLAIKYETWMINDETDFKEKKWAEFEVVRVATSSKLEAGYVILGLNLLGSKNV